MVGESTETAEAHFPVRETERLTEIVTPTEGTVTRQLGTTAIDCAISCTHLVNVAGQPQCVAPVTRQSESRSVS